MPITPPSTRTSSRSTDSFYASVHEAQVVPVRASRVPPPQRIELPTPVLDAHAIFEPLERAPWWRRTLDKLLCRTV